MTFGFERGRYNVSEGDGPVEVCVKVKSGILQNSLCVSITITTVDGDASGEQCPWYL